MEKNYKFTADQLAEMKRLYCDEHVSSREIERRWGLSRNAVRHALINMGVEMRSPGLAAKLRADAMSTWTEERDSIIRQMWGRHTAGAIARTLGGITDKAVAGRAHRLGLPRHKPKSASQVAVFASATREAKFYIHTPLVLFHDRPDLQMAFESHAAAVRAERVIGAANG